MIKQADYKIEVFLEALLYFWNTRQIVFNYGGESFHNLFPSIN